MDEQSPREKLADMLRVTLERMPECPHLVQVAEVGEYELEVSYRDESLTDRSFRITVGEVEGLKVNRRTGRTYEHHAARKFISLLRRKLGVVSTPKLSEAKRDAILARVRTFTQYVTACDNEKCDRIGADSLVGWPCLHCGVGTFRRYEITQPAMPVLGLTGRKRLVDPQPPGE